MGTGYKINGIEIQESFESFPVEIVENYEVQKSNFSNGKFRKSGNGLAEYVGVVFPTSAGSHIGGFNEIQSYKTNGMPVDVALKGCRPIGIHLMDLDPGTYYLNRVNKQTWISSVPNSATGTRLQYDPKALHIELLGGGGGGAGSATLYASAGGGAGAYCYIPVELQDNSYLMLVVGSAGRGGDAREAGAAGGESRIVTADSILVCRAGGGQGGGINNESGGQGGYASGGRININGGQGGNKENSGSSVPQFNVILDKPEVTIWSRGGFSGGPSQGNNYGGGGGASAYAAGAAGDSQTTPNSAILGAGGAGAGFKAAAASRGGDGGAGLIRLYY